MKTCRMGVIGTTLLVTKEYPTLKNRSGGVGSGGGRGA